MRVFVAGATGAIGKQLVPRLVAAGHEVHGMTRSQSRQALLHDLGAVPVVADALDPDQVAEALARVKPDVIVHQLTAIGAVDTRHMERDFAPTNRLRTEGTDHLLSAAQAVGVRRFVAQSNGAFVYARSGGAVKSEEDPLDPTPVRKMRAIIAALRHLEGAVLGADWTQGIVLDDPARVAEWLPALALAQALGAKKPRRVPLLIGRLFAGECGVQMMTELRGASNAKAKRELAWRPAHTSWRQGFAAA